MLKSLLAIIFIFPLIGHSQISMNCNKVYFEEISNYVNFNDSVKFNLSDSADTGVSLRCLEDTVSIISFVLNKEEFLKYNIKDSLNEMDKLYNITESNLVNNTKYLNKINPDSIINPFYFPQTAVLTKRSNYVPLEVLKLYFVSALYYNDFSFKRKIVLVKGKKEATVNYNLEKDIPRNKYVLEIVNQKIIDTAAKSYNKWRELVELKGLDYVRKKGISPLHFAKKVKWKD